jgi:hypothetical protein
VAFLESRCHMTSWCIECSDFKLKSLEQELLRIWANARYPVGRMGCTLVSPVERKPATPDKKRAELKLNVVCYVLLIYVSELAKQHLDLLDAGNQM